MLRLEQRFSKFAPAAAGAFRHVVPAREHLQKVRHHQLAERIHIAACIEMQARSGGDALIHAVGSPGKGDALLRAAVFAHEGCQRTVGLERIGVADVHLVSIRKSVLIGVGLERVGSQGDFETVVETVVVRVGIIRFRALGQLPGVGEAVVVRVARGAMGWIHAATVVGIQAVLGFPCGR